MIIRHPGRSRNGFTLVEMLLVIAIIGILIGMLSMAVIPALRTAKETTIVVEMQQLELAIEQFKQKFGFYPPSFESGTRSSTGAAVGIDDPSDLIPYIRRMSPNHAELTPSGVGGRTRLEHWWIEVGQYLDQESSLVFWLSGVCRNKQFPITGGGDISGWSAGTPPLAAHSFVDDGIERELFYDFKNGQIVGDQLGESVYYPDPMTAVQTLIPQSVVGAIYEYEQPHAGTDGETYTAPDGMTSDVADYRFKYRDWVTYDIGGGNTAYYTGNLTGLEWPVPGTPAADYPFLNAKGFQLISFGMDGLSGAPGNVFAIDGGIVNFGGKAFFGPWGADNICSFTDGRLEKYVVSVK